MDVQAKHAQIDTRRVAATRALLAACTLEELEQLAEEMRPRLEAAIASTDALTFDERRARAGIVARQVSLR